MYKPISTTSISEDGLICVGYTKRNSQHTERAAPALVAVSLEDPLQSEALSR